MPRGPTRTLGQRALDDVWRISLAVMPLIIVVPLVLQRGFASLRPDRHSRLFEFAGVSVVTAVMLAAARIVVRRRIRGAAVLPVACFLLVVFAAVQRLGPFPTVGWDFLAYERAGDAMRAGETPYPLVNPYYTYPPPLVQAMAAMTSAIQTLTGKTRAAAWYDVFYLWALVQIGLIAAAYVMLFRFAAALCLDETPAAVIVALLLIVDTPLMITIETSQMNILILTLVLAAVTWAGRIDAVAGLLLAAAAVIKLYPFMLLPAWFAAGQRRAAAWAVVWTAAIIAVSQPWKWWIEFVRLWMRPAVYPTAGDNTLFNVFANGARFLGLASHDAPPPSLRYLWLAAVAAVSVWGVRRIVARIEAQRHASGDLRLLGADLLACSAEVLAISLFLSPLVWTHHFLFALPLAVFAAATAPPERRYLVGVGAMLMFAMPWSDLFLFGYHKLLGLCLVLYACRPGPTADPSAETEDRLKVGLETTAKRFSPMFPIVSPRQGETRSSRSVSTASAVMADSVSPR